MSSAWQLAAAVAGSSLLLVPPLLGSTPGSGALLVVAVAVSGVVVGSAVARLRPTPSTGGHPGLAALHPPPWRQVVTGLYAAGFLAGSICFVVVAARLVETALPGAATVAAVGFAAAATLHAVLVPPYPAAAAVARAGGVVLIAVSAALTPAVHAVLADNPLSWWAAPAALIAVVGWETTAVATARQRRTAVLLVTAAFAVVVAVQPAVAAGLLAGRPGSAPPGLHGTAAAVVGGAVVVGLLSYTGGNVAAITRFRLALRRRGAGVEDRGPGARRAVAVTGAGLAVAAAAVTVVQASPALLLTCCGLCCLGIYPAAVRAAFRRPAVGRSPIDQEASAQPS